MTCNNTIPYRRSTFNKRYKILFFNNLIIKFKIFDNVRGVKYKLHNKFYMQSMIFL